MYFYILIFNTYLHPSCIVSAIQCKQNDVTLAAWYFVESNQVSDGTLCRSKLLFYFEVVAYFYLFDSTHAGLISATAVNVRLEKCGWVAPRKYSQEAGYAHKPKKTLWGSINNMLHRELAYKKQAWQRRVDFRQTSVIGGRDPPKSCLTVSVLLLLYFFFLSRQNICNFASCAKSALKQI